MKPTLYIFVGYPGAGKTTVARIIAEKTGAAHLWADRERRRMFGDEVSHSPMESHALYNHLNEYTELLLSEGKSVIFDTNFNFYKDREHLRQIADRQDANTVVIWITTPMDLAKQRAVHDRQLRNGYEFYLPEAQFDRMSHNLQPPNDDENAVKLDGTNLTKEEIYKAVGL